MLVLLLRLRFGFRYGNVFGDSRLTTRLKSCWSISQWEKLKPLLSHLMRSSNSSKRSSMLLVELAFGFSARVETEWMFQLTTVFWTCSFVLQTTLKLASEIMLKASKLVLGRECQGCPHCYPKKKWRLPSQVDPLDYLEYAPDRSGVWRRNYATLREFESEVLEVMHDQAPGGQITVMTESEARSRYLDLVVASLGAQRKQKPGGKVTARVLFNGTHGL